MMPAEVTRKHFRILVCRSQKSTLGHGCLKQNGKPVERIQGTWIMHRKLDPDLGNRQNTRGVQAM